MEGSVERREVLIPAVVTLYKSSSGKTYYASININYEHYVGSSMESHDAAIEDLKAKIVNDK